jgi:hypothetical protein
VAGSRIGAPEVISPFSWAFGATSAATTAPTEVPTMFHGSMATPLEHNVSSNQAYAVEALVLKRRVEGLSTSVAHH